MLFFPASHHQFSAVLRQQADLTIEADNLRRFEDFFHARDLAVVFPRPVDGLVSRRVLTMSWENGCGLGEFIEKASAPAKARMAALGFDVFMSMLIMDNFVHVDSHVGNSMVQPSVWRHEEMRKSVARKSGADKAGSGFNFAAIASEFTLAAAANLPPSVDPSIKPVVGAIAASVASMGEAVVNHGSISRASPGESLVCIDAGMVASLSKAGRAHLISMLIDIVKADGEHAAKMCVHLSRNGCPGGASGERAFYANCKALFDREVSQRRAAGHAVNVHCLLQGIMNAVRDAHMELDSEFATIMVAMETQESVARALQPDIDLVAKVVPFLFKHPSAALKFWINDRLPDAAR